MSETGIDARKWYEWRRIIHAFPKKRQEQIKQALSDSAELVLRRAKTHYLTGAALKVRTGRLRSSVTKMPSTGAYHIGNLFQVHVGTNVEYGRAWELGFTIPAFTIVPRAKKALAFKMGGESVIVKKVRIPARTVKPRKWLEPAIRDEIPNIVRLLERAGVKFV